MQRLLKSFIFVTCAVVLMQVPAVAQIPDISGSWERARDASIPAAPQPPLKPQYLKEWQARQQAAREASAKGKPVAERVVNCLPDGMPGMMAGPFPFEFLQARDR